MLGLAKYQFSLSQVAKVKGEVEICFADISDRNLIFIYFLFNGAHHLSAEIDVRIVNTAVFYHL